MGSPTAIGEGHGRAFSAQIHKNIEFYRRCFSAQGLSLDESLAIAAQYRAPLAQHAPEILAEIEGIAAGAGVSADLILMLNARTEILSAAERSAAAKRAGTRPSPGCTSVAVSDGHRIALGQNWDWEAEAAENPVMLTIEREDGRTLTTLTEAGIVAKMGVNSDRVGVCLNFLHHGEEYGSHPPGLPVHVLLRLVLDSRSLEEAVARVTRAPRSASINILIAQHRRGGPESLDLELTPRRFKVLRPEHGVQSHANHFQDPELAAGGTNAGNRSSFDRARRAAQIASRRRGLLPPVARLRAALLDHTMPTPISKAPGDDPEVTLASIVMDLSPPSGPTVDIAVGAPHQAGFYRYA